ncbi:hypothetical protein N0V91_007000 [Didymella pomorum]|uniref:Uncharacterized protein n=1 Tax=Didymella pomorum TaxID=749634 RepID=A0A9W8ZDR1_9PLEO|nr:hypothetical protein N0V91_007000 [Didymella pomorum]
MTNRDEQGPLRKEVLIPKYELDWSTLKAWLDTRFASYNYTFTERFNVVCAGDKYLVYIPEDLTEQDKEQISKLREE